MYKRQGEKSAQNLCTRNKYCLTVMNGGNFYLAGESKVSAEPCCRVDSVTCLTRVTACLPALTASVRLYHVVITLELVVCVCVC